MMSEIRTIENERLLVSVSDHGAELSRIYDKKNDREVLWGADPAHWNRHAPILFPFVGKVRGGCYRHEGVSYELKLQHGFARDREFAFLGAEENVIRHRLCSDAETKALYPFDFALETACSLKDNVLKISWTVENTGDREMYFSIGGHPAFHVPALPGTVRSDYFLTFAGEKELTYIQIDDKESLAFPEKKYTLELTDGTCPITDHMFDRDALIFEDGQVKQVGLALPDGTPYVTMRCADFPYMGVWSKPDAPFVCLEPWIGRTDDAGFMGELKDKPGERRLEAGEKITVSHEIEIY